MQIIIYNNYFTLEVLKKINISIFFTLFDFESYTYYKKLFYIIKILQIKSVSIKKHLRSIKP